MCPLREVSKFIGIPGRLKLNVIILVATGILGGCAVKKVCSVHPTFKALVRIKGKCEGIRYTNMAFSEKPPIFIENEPCSNHQFLGDMLVFRAWTVMSFVDGVSILSPQKKSGKHLVWRVWRNFSI